MAVVVVVGLYVEEEGSDEEEEEEDDDEEVGVAVAVVLVGVGVLGAAVAATVCGDEDGVFIWKGEKTATFMDEEGKGGREREAATSERSDEDLEERRENGRERKRMMNDGTGKNEEKSKVKKK